MRLGYLGRLNDLPLNGQMLGSHPGIPSDLHRAGHPAGGILKLRSIQFFLRKFIFTSKLHWTKKLRNVKIMLCYFKAKKMFQNHQYRKLINSRGILRAKFTWQWAREVWP